jgi:hypothetical protein
VDDDLPPRPSNMPQQYQHYSFPRSCPPAQRDFISLRHRSPNFKGGKHTRIQDVNFDDSSVEARTSEFVTAPEECGTSNMGRDSVRSYASDIRTAWKWVEMYDNSHT